MVLAENGQEYGPAGMDTLRRWVSDGRIRSSTQLRELSSGRIISATTIPGLIVDRSDFNIGAPSVAYSEKGDSGALIKISIYSGLAVLVFFLLRGIGVIFAGFALYDAIRVKISGDKYGNIAVVIASTALLLVGIGWLMRMSGSPT